MKKLQKLCRQSRAKLALSLFLSFVLPLVRELAFENLQHDPLPVVLHAIRGEVERLAARTTLCKAAAEDAAVIPVASRLLRDVHRRDAGPVAKVNLALLLVHVLRLQILPHCRLKISARAAHRVVVLYPLLVKVDHSAAPVHLHVHRQQKQVLAKDGVWQRLGQLLHAEIAEFKRRQEVRCGREDVDHALGCLAALLDELVVIVDDRVIQPARPLQRAKRLPIEIHAEALDEDFLLRAYHHLLDLFLLLWCYDALRLLLAWRGALLVPLVEILKLEGTEVRLLLQGEAAGFHAGPLLGYPPTHGCCIKGVHHVARQRRVVLALALGIVGARRRGSGSVLAGGGGPGGGCGCRL
eukprot:m.128099 g.128099  ORF g.128099 m.128099 type:complete len:353 (+) comp16383_c0_seq3:177-1235(+)